MNIDRYERNKNRLLQAFGDKFEPITKEMEALLAKYNLDVMPETAYDLFCYVLEHRHLEKFNLPEYKK